MQQIEKNRKNIAISLRQEGLSYSEIKKSVLVPKSTIAHWVKSIKLTPTQLQKLKLKRLEAAKAGSQTRTLRVTQRIEEIKINSAQNIKQISARELWLMGIMLYYRERTSETDLRKGVRFSSSNPYLIKLFLKWLHDVGKIKREEIGFDIFLAVSKQGSADSAIGYWSKVTDFPPSYFSHIYFQKVKLKRLAQKIEGQKKVGYYRKSKRSPFGFLRTRVKASSMLARQINGWIMGIHNIIKFKNV